MTVSGDNKGTWGWRQMVSPLLSAAIVAVISVPTQGYLIEWQIEKQFEITRNDAERQRREGIVEKFTKLHEKLKHANLKWYFAGELENLRGTLIMLPADFPQAQRDAINGVVDDLARRMGVSDKDAAFSSSAAEFSELHAQITGLVDAARFYFSEKPIKLANQYLDHLSSSDGRERERALQWVKIGQLIIKMSETGQFNLQIIADELYGVISHNASAQDIRDEYFNRFHDVMISEAESANKG